MALGVERAANGGHAAIHHVAGSDNVGAGFGLAHCRTRQQLERGIVVHFEVRMGAGTRLDHYAAVAVAGVFAQAKVGDQDEFLRGFRLLERAQRLLHDASVFPCAGALIVLRLGQAKE